MCVVCVCSLKKLVSVDDDLKLLFRSSTEERHFCVSRTLTTYQKLASVIVLVLQIRKKCMSVILERLREEEPRKTEAIQER